MSAFALPQMMVLAWNGFRFGVGPIKAFWRWPRVALPHGLIVVLGQHGVFACDFDFWFVNLHTRAKTRHYAALGI